MDPFESFLMSSPGQQVSPETLEMIGRKASQMFVQQQIPLNDAISQLASQHPELGNEHIKRIVEFSNTVTFQEMFANSADKNVHFAVADPGVVIRDLKDGGSPAHDGKTLQGGMGDYLSPPNSQEQNGSDQVLESAFGVEGQSEPLQKIASSETDTFSHSNPVEDVTDLRHRLEDTRDRLVSAHEQFDMLLKQAKEELFEIVKGEVTDPDGSGLGGVLGALKKVASEVLISGVVTPIVRRLSEENDFSSDALERSLEKKAGAVVNLAHPLLVCWAGLVKCAEEKLKSELAIQEVNKHLAEVNTFLRKSAGALTSGVRNALKVRGKIPASLRQRFPRVKK